MERLSTRLRALLRSKTFLHMPSVYDALGGRLVQSLGYVAARQEVEDLINLDEYYAIEAQTVETRQKK
jgi:hypothetical protein